MPNVVIDITGYGIGGTATGRPTQYKELIDMTIIIEL